jgi:hypothetical protein
MASQKDINNLIRSAGNRISYAAVDQSLAKVTNNYLVSNITKLGLQSGNTIVGYQAVTQDVDYPDQLVFGTSIAVLNDTSLPIDNVVPDLSQTIPGNTISYDEDYDATNGADPAFSSGPIPDGSSLTSLLTLWTNWIPVPDLPYRMVINGSPRAVHDNALRLQGLSGPFDNFSSYGLGDSDSFNSYLPSVKVTSQALATIVNAISGVKQ